MLVYQRVYIISISPKKIMTSATISNQGVPVPRNDWGLCVARGIHRILWSSVQPVPAAVGTVHATCQQKIICEPTPAPRVVWNHLLQGGALQFCLRVQNGL